jgi:hypothetical protein
MSNTKLNLNSVSSVTNINLYSTLERIDVIENSDSIEFVYKETSTISYTLFPPPPPQVRVFKIIFSCVDGKWNKSERIYGQIVPAENERYVF